MCILQSYFMKFKWIFRYLLLHLPKRIYYCIIITTFWSSQYYLFKRWTNESFRNFSCSRSCLSLTIQTSLESIVLESPCLFDSMKQLKITSDMCISYLYDGQVARIWRYWIRWLTGKRRILIPEDKCWRCIEIDLFGFKVNRS